MHDELETRLEAARDALEPDPVQTERVRAAILMGAVEQPGPPSSRTRQPMRSRGWALVLIPVVGAGGAALAISALGGGPASPPVCRTFTAPGGAVLQYAFHSAHAALGQHGNALVAWLGRDGAVRVSERPAGGAWGMPKQISSPSPLHWQPRDITLAMNQAGMAVVGWTSRRTEVAARDAQGHWSPPQTLALARYRTPPYEPPDLAINARGAAAVVFTAARSVGYSKGGGASVGDPFPTLATRRSPTAPFQVKGPLPGASTGGRTDVSWSFFWGSLTSGVGVSDQGTLLLLGRAQMPGGMGVAALSGTLSGRLGSPVGFRGFSNSAPMVGFDRRGNAIGAWTRGTNIVVGRLNAGRRRWTTEIVANAGVFGALGSLAVSANGDAVVVWRGRAPGVPGPRFVVRDPTARRDRQIQAAVYSAATGRWTRSPVLSEIGQPVGTPRVAIDAAGHAIAVWVQGANNGRTPSQIMAADYTPGRGWSPQQAISPPATGPVSPDVALSPSGEAIAAWVGCQGSQATVRTATKTSGGAWTKPSDLPAP